MKSRNIPGIAILEAMRKAPALGCRIVEFRNDRNLPVHFVIYDHCRYSIVRVRRIKYPGYRCGEIERSCAADLREIRRMDLAPDIHRELWVRGPDRPWHRYAVYPDHIKALVCRMIN